METPLECNSTTPVTGQQRLEESGQCIGATAYDQGSSTKRAARTDDMQMHQIFLEKG